MRCRDAALMKLTQPTVLFDRRLRGAARPGSRHNDCRPGKKNEIGVTQLKKSRYS